MVLAEPHAKHSFMKRLKEEWACSTPEEVGHEGWVRFVVRAAMELPRGSQEVEGGTAVLHPRSVESHQVEHPRPVPQTKAHSGLPEEEQPAIESIRQAQTVVGVHKDKTGCQLRQPTGQTGEQAAQIGGENSKASVWVYERNQDSASQFWSLHE